MNYDTENVMPQGWAWTTLDEIFRVVGGGTPPTDNPVFWNGDIPWITSADIYGLKDIQPRKLITEEAIQSSATNLVPKGSIIVVTRVSLGKVAITLYPLCFSQDSQALIDDTGFLNKEYVLYFLSQAVRRFKYESRGTTIAGVTKKQLVTLRLPLPPLPEQQRIVEVIEAEFTRLDVGVAALKRLRANLKRYKAAVLKAAAEGKLVPQDPHGEPAADLLKRILRERRLKWEADQRAKGRDPQKLKYEEPKAPDTEDLPELPEGWVWASLEMLGQIRNGVTKGRNLNGAQTITVPYLRVANVQDGFLDLDEVKTIEIKSDELERFRLKAGDILFNEGGDRDKLGRGAIWTGIVENCIHQNHVYAVRLYSEAVSAEWIHLVRQIDYSREYFWRVASQTVNLASINATNLRSLPIPIPPKNHQVALLDEVDRLMSLFDELGELIRFSLKRAERLRQAILRDAFAGRLVAQDPNDELASELLKRIQKARKQRTAKRTS